jgi:hypothetical protein
MVKNYIAGEQLHLVGKPGGSAFLLVIPDRDLPKNAFRLLRTSDLKHGPHGLGGPGPCDADCVKCRVMVAGERMYKAAVADPYEDHDAARKRLMETLGFTVVGRAEAAWADDLYDLYAQRDKLAAQAVDHLAAERPLTAGESFVAYAAYAARETESAIASAIERETELLWRESFISATARADTRDHRRASRCGARDVAARNDHPRRGARTARGAGTRRPA